jgi:NADH:ubiquinone oxidoreductase subunit 6 (subunit J)
MPPPLFSAGLADYVGPFGLVVLPLLAGAAAIYLLLPRPKALPALWGTLAGVAALGLAGWLLVGVGVLTPETFLFYAFSATAIGFGALLVTQRNPARAALSFALVVLATCGLFLLLAAPFLMAATIIVYAGAIIVTFLFVLMLAQQEGPSDADARSREPLLATAVGFVLLGALLYVLQLQLTSENDEEGRLLAELVQSTRAAKADAKDDGMGGTKYRSDILKPLTAAIEDKDRQLNDRNQTAADRLAVEKQREPLQKLKDRLDAVFVDQWPVGDPPPTDKIRDALARVETVLYQARQQHGWPQAGPGSPLSTYSGPPPNLPPEQVRVDPAAGGRPYLPADNPGYLGKSLFTDYLLPVELGGFLLLVAAVGAVAIAQRRPPTERPS